LGGKKLCGTRGGLSVKGGLFGKVQVEKDVRVADSGKT